MNKSIVISRRDLIKNVLPTLKTGDVILCANKSIIVWFMKKFQDDPVHWGHCLIVKDKDVAWEAFWTIREYSLSKFFKNKVYWRIARKKDISEDNRANMLMIVPPLLGRFYGLRRILLQALDHIFKTNRFSSSYKNVYDQVCSSFCSWIYETSCGYRFNDVPWMSCDPDDIEDDWEKNPDSWEILEERLDERE